MIDIIFTIENIHSDKFIYNLTRIYFCFTINQYKSYFQKLIPLAFTSNVNIRKNVVSRENILFSLSTRTK